MTDRDEEICRVYLSGTTLEDCGQQFGLTRERVRQILRKAGILKVGRPMKSDREEFLGVNLSWADKEALRVEAVRRGMSMSSLTADLIKEMLAARNV